MRKGNYHVVVVKSSIPQKRIDVEAGVTDRELSSIR